MSDTCDGDTEWGLVERFHIDDGELAGISPEEAFVMGVQFMDFRNLLLKTDYEFTMMVVPQNVNRILKMCWNNKRHASQSPSTVEGWVEIRVEKK